MFIVLLNIRKPSATSVIYTLMNIQHTCIRIENESAIQRRSNLELMFVNLGVQS